MEKKSFFVIVVSRNVMEGGRHVEMKRNENELSHEQKMHRDSRFFLFFLIGKCNLCNI